VNDAALAVPATGIEAAGASRLEVRSLQKSYGKRQVVKDVSLSVLNGEVVGLLGPNGAGKTTSFYMIVGLVRADAGEISIDGQRIDSMPIHRRSRLGLSYLPQEASIFRKLTVSENVRAVLELQHDSAGKPLDKAEIDRRLNGLLQDLRVEHLYDSPAPALSGGERRRVEIARALATQPRFILLDEPFAGIDPIAVIEIQRIVAFLKSRGIGVLITDHNVRETLGICDHAYIISDGKVLARARPQRSWTTPRCAACTWANTSECNDGPHACHCVCSSVRALARGDGSSALPSLRRQAWSRGPQPRGGSPCLGRPGAAASGRRATMKQGLSLRVSQHLALTPQLQQSIRLLQLSTLELSQEVEQMLDDNPFLELNAGGGAARGIRPAAGGHPGAPR
jgi:lipopolysaccharide export system ATP-binding protein